MHYMKPLIFKSLLLLLFLSTSVFSQKKHVYVESFEANAKTTAILNIGNSAVRIEPSPDHKVYVDYSLEFEGYSKEEIKNILKKSKIEGHLYNNHITITAGEIPEISSEIIYEGKEVITIDLNNGLKDRKKLKIFCKSKDSLISEIKIDENKKSRLSNFVMKLTNKVKKMKGVTNYNLKGFQSDFTIKVPPSLKLTINGRKSSITLVKNVNNELSVNLKGGKLKAASLQNAKIIKIVNAGFEVKDIESGNYILKNIMKGKIGSVSNATITSEFSKIEIGEINQGVVINDFNSEYRFYNFSSDFKRFDLFSEYSKIHMFESVIKYSFKAIGNNTVFHQGETKISMQPTKNGEKFNMVEKKAKENEKSAGHINMDIIHGVIYSHNNKTKPSKK